MGRPSETGRDKVYAALRAAGTDGLSEGDLHAAAPLAGHHVASLIAEGHGIRSDMERDERGALQAVWRLTKDAWA